MFLFNPQDLILDNYSFSLIIGGIFINMEEIWEKENCLWVLFSLLEI